MRTKLSYARNQVRPEAWLWLLDDDESLMDLSSGTFRSMIGYVDAPALKVKTTGFTGALGSGNEQNGSPNLRIAWVTGDLDIAPGKYILQIEWNIGSDTPRYWFDEIEITGIMTVPV